VYAFRSHHFKAISLIFNVYLPILPAQEAFMHMWRDHSGHGGGLHARRSAIRMNFVLAITVAMALIVFLPAAIAAEGGQSSGSGGPAASVDPIIGTGKGPGGGQNLFPGATTPFGMVQLSPDTENHGYGYHYNQPNIRGFSMTHMSGPGCANEGDVFFTPTTGPVETATSAFESPYSHSAESASPGYYEVQLSRWGVKAELTATDRTGIARFTFPAGKPANVLLPISHTLNYTTAAEVHVTNKHEITGFVEDRAFCGNKQTYKVYFVMEFSRPFASFGTWTGDTIGGPGKVSSGSRQATQAGHEQWIGAYATWPSSSDSRTITVKVGISYVDLKGAENNLKVEAAHKSFDKVRSNTRAAWNKALSVIDVSGGTVRNRKVFYTALYHSLLMPSIFSDVDGRYLGFDAKIHHVAKGHLIYCNYSGWDIYRSEIPLLAMVAPRRMEDMAESVVLMYKQGGWIGRWPQINLYTNVMAGSPLTVALANAWLDGLHGFDIKAAWEGMYKDATEAPPAGKVYVGQEGINWINKLHYVPNDKISYGSVSQIQEDCIAYASLYYLAKDLGKTQEAKTLYERALYYRNVFDHQDGFFRPRNADGKWVPGFNPASERRDTELYDEVQKLRPKQRKQMMQAYFEMRNKSEARREQFLKSPQVQQNFSPHERALLERASKLMAPTGFIEGSGWHYQWLAPSDMAWLVNAMGKERFNQRLEEFFNYPKPGWYGQYYNPYNETDLEAPFEFNFSGMPWETQRVVRRVLKENYTTDYDGIPGNDDCGEMSSWAVLTMMGIYTVDPASLAYELVSPVFSKVVVHLQAPYAGKTFTVEASSNPEAKPYIQSVKLNGKVHSKNWIKFGDISAGGSLQFTLGPEPNKTWGAAASDAPPSISEMQP
jgi:predicted alpha-1,2-mannosidase